MIRIVLTADNADKCETATLTGIVRRALQADPAFRAYAAATHATLTIVTPADTLTGWSVDAEPIDAPAAAPAIPIVRPTIRLTRP